MDKLLTILSIVKQRGANLFGKKSNDKADISKNTLPLTNKDLGKSNLNYDNDIALIPNEQQNQLQPEKRFSPEDLVGISFLQFELENMPMLFLLKLPNWTYYKKEINVESYCIAKQIVDRSLHHSLSYMWEQLREDRTFSPHEMSALKKMFKRQIKFTLRRKESDTIIGYQISMCKQMIKESKTVMTKCAFDMTETFQLIYVAPSAIKNEFIFQKSPTVRQIDMEPIAVATQKKSFVAMNIVIGICLLLKLPTFYWLLDSSFIQTKNDTTKTQEEIENDKLLELITAGILYWFTMGLFLLASFTSLNEFNNKLYVLYPKQAIRLQKIRLVSAIVVLSVQCVYPVIKCYFQLAPLFVYILPSFTPKIVLTTISTAFFIIFLISHCFTEAYIFFGYSRKCFRKMEANKAAIGVEKNPTEIEEDEFWAKTNLSGSRQVAKEICKFL